MNVYKPEGTLIGTKRNYEYTSSVAGLERAAEKNRTLEGIVMLCDHDFSLHINLPCGIKAIIPRDEAVMPLGSEGTKDIAILTRVGKAVCFKVKEFRKTATNETVAILSRKNAQIECYEKYVSELHAGDIIPAKVTHIEGFGAFLDIGCGIISLLSIDSISVSRISNPSERLSIGDNVFAVVKGRDDLGRLCLSMRELLGTWEENSSLFSEGETVSGIVRSVENYGIFVELAPNLAGLAEYKENVRSGQLAAVYIKSIIPDKMKIKLIIIDTHEIDNVRQPLNYFVDTDKINHIDSWVYSPVGAKKIVESIF